MYHLLPMKTEHIWHNSLLAFHILQGQQNLLQNLGKNHATQLRKIPNESQKELNTFISTHLLINHSNIKEAQHTDILFKPLFELEVIVIILFPRISDWVTDQIAILTASAPKNLTCVGTVIFRSQKAKFTAKWSANYNSKECSTKTQWTRFGLRHKADSLCLSNHLSADQCKGNDRAQQCPSSPVPEGKEHQEGNEDMKTSQSWPFQRATRNKAQPHVFGITDVLLFDKSETGIFSWSPVHLHDHHDCLLPISELDKVKLLLTKQEKT